MTQLHLAQPALGRVSVRYRRLSRSGNGEQLDASNVTGLRHQRSQERLNRPLERRHSTRCKHGESLRTL